MLTITLLLSLAVSAIDSAEVCCGDLGCFSDEKPWGHVPLPWCPDEIQPMYRIFTRSNRKRFHIVQHGNPGVTWDGSRRTVLISHGWQGDADMDWVIEMKNKFLDKGDFNVITIDWRWGSRTGIDYPVAASNTRVMAADINKLIRGTLMSRGLSAENVYCIGHSLGAHLCGLAGHQLNGTIGRITGLDPAGPWWQPNPASARLAPGSARFVDVIHSDGDCLIYCLGIGKNVGHIDFYPNGNAKQPGCITMLHDGKAVEKRSEDTRGNIVSCSHHRAIEYYLESMTSQCPFTSVSCPGGWRDEEAGGCDECEGDECQHMGYDAEQRKGRGRFYLKTNSYRPFCKK